MRKLEKAIEGIRQELAKPLPEPRIIDSPTGRKPKEKKMAKKAKKAAEASEATETKSKKKSKAKAEVKAKKKSKKAEANGEDGLITLKDLAAEAGIEPTTARAKLRAAEVSRPEGSRWGWKDGSKDLKKAREALGL